MLLIRPATINDAALVSSNVAESEAVYNPATTYAQGAIVRGNTTPTQHMIYLSAQAANTGHPLTDLAWWIPAGRTNRWAMFDTAVTSQTTNPDSIEVELTTPGRVDSVALLNISGATVQVMMTDATEGVVFDETYPLTSDSGVIDWYAYFFEPIVRKTDLVVSGMPPYAGAEVAVILTDTGNTAKIGALVMGQSRFIGDAQYGATVGIKDFSRKEQDQLGNFTIVERAFSKRADFTVWMDAGATDEVVRLLSNYRAEPTVYIGSEAYGSTFIFGFFRDFNVELAGPNHSLCSITIEGLT